MANWKSTSDHEGIMIVAFHDIRFGLRLMRRSPGYTLLIIFVLAIGIGTNSTIYGIVDAILFRPLPYDSPERLVLIGETHQDFRGIGAVPYATFMDWKSQSQVFEKLTSSLLFEFTVTGGSHEPENVNGCWVASDYFATFGAKVSLGRHFLPENFRAGAERVVVVSDGLWRRRFGAASDVLGSALILNGVFYRVVGAMSRNVVDFSEQYANFRSGSSQKVELWTPLVPEYLPLPKEIILDRQAEFLDVIGRLKPGISLEKAQADMNTIAGRLAVQYPDTNRLRGALVVSLHDYLRRDSQSILFILWAAVGLVLAIACANAANLLLARAAGREKEIAIKSALGASKIRLLRQLLSESLLLAFLGGVAGVFLAYWGISVANIFKLSTEMSLPSLQMDFRVLGFTLLITVLTGIVFGLAPALKSFEVNLIESLKSTTTHLSSREHRHFLRQVLVVTEMALSLVLLIGAGLLINSLFRLAKVNPGFRPENVLTLLIDLPSSRYPREGQQINFFQQAIEKVSVLPGVQAASIVNLLPTAGSSSTDGFAVEGDMPLPREKPSAEIHMTSPRYLDVMEIPLLQGRFISEQDNETSPPVMVVNQTLARRFFGNQSPLGRRIQLGKTWRTVIGIVSDVKHRGIAAESSPEIYVPYQQYDWFSRMVLAVRTQTDPLAMVAAVTQAIRTVDKDLAFTRVRTMASILSGSTATNRLMMGLMSFFAVVAMLLAVMGIYGVVSYSVSRRTREIGIRMALGAHQRDVLRMVIGDGMVLTGIGMIIGLLGAFTLTRFMSGFLYNLSVTDPLTFVGVSLLLAGVAVLACYVPALRATRVNPIVALRHE
jgi:putative ABC transport system permease protein